MSEKNSFANAFHINTTNHLLLKFIKTKLIQSLSHPLFYVIAILFEAIAVVNYFVVHRFFLTGTSDLQNFFSVIPIICVVAVPIICIKNESDKYDDFLPLTNAQKIFGMWLASYIKYLLMVLPLTAVPLCVNFFGDIDIGQAATGFVLLALYGASAVSLATFAVTLFYHSLIVLVASAALLAFFCAASAISPVFSAISFSHHFDAASKGIFDSRDAVFYVATAAMFLTLASYTTEKKRGRKFGANAKISFALILAIILLLFFDSSRFYFRLDTTRDKKFSVTPYTRSLLSEIEEPMHITYFRSKKLLQSYSGVRDIEDYLDVWCGQNKNITLEKIDASDENVQRNLLQYGIMGQQLPSSVSATGYETIYSAILMEYGGNIDVIPIILAANMLEYELGSRVEIIAKNRTRKAMLVSANSLSIENDYSYIIPWLSSQGIACTVADISSDNFLTQLENFSANTEGGVSDALDTNGTIVIFGAQKFTDATAQAIEQFVMRGGSVLFALSPYDVDIAGDWSVSKNSSPIFDVLRSWGIEFENAIVEDKSCAAITMVSGESAKSGHTQKIAYPFWVNVLPQERAKQGATLFWASPILSQENSHGENNSQSKKFTSSVNTILTSSKNSEAVAESSSASDASLFDTNPFVNYQLSIVNSASSIPLAVEKTGSFTSFYTGAVQENAHVIVVADQYFVSSLMLEYAGGEYGDLRNLDFLTNCILRLNGENALADIHNKSPFSTSLYKITDESSFASARTKTFVFVFLLPCAFYFALAAVVHFLRKKKMRSLVPVQSFTTIKSEAIK